MESHKIPFISSLRFKITAFVIACTLALSIGLIQYNFTKTRDLFINNSKNLVKCTTNNAWLFVDATFNDVRSGKLTKEKAIEIIQDRISGPLQKIVLDFEQETELIEFINKHESNCSVVVEPSGNKKNIQIVKDGERIEFGFIQPRDGRFQLNIVNMDYINKYKDFFLTLDKVEQISFQKRHNLFIVRDISKASFKIGHSGYVFSETAYYPEWLLDGTVYPDDYTIQAIQKRIDNNFSQVNIAIDKKDYFDKFGATAQEQHTYIKDYMTRDHTPALDIKRNFHFQLGGIYVNNYGNFEGVKVGREIAVRKNGWFEYYWKSILDKKPRKKFVFMKLFEYRDKNGRVDNNIRWVITAGAYEDESFSPILILQRNLYIATIITAFIIVVFIVWYLNSCIIHPVKHILKAFNELEKNNLKHRIDMKQLKNRHDEIGMAVNSFNEMAGELESAHDSLKKAEEKYRGIFENSIEGIFQSTREGKFITANKSFLKMFGFASLDELADFKEQANGLYQDSAARGQLLTMLEAQATVQDFEVEFKRHDGTRFMGVINARLTNSPQYHELVIEGTVQDITTRREKEKAIQEREAAEAASQAKSQFLAHMSHEIRTPMNAVIGLVLLTLRTELTPKQRDYLRKIHSSAKALLGILNDILDFSKIEAGKLSLEKIVFDLNDVMDNVSNVVSLKSQEKGLELLFHQDSRLPLKVMGDPLRLGQVIINLATNAVKFTKKGEIVISTTLIDQGDGWVRAGFSVRDSGIGMSEQQMSGLFQSFHQVDSSVTRHFGGTGLGLAISKQLVEMMGGTLSVVSAPGRGSTFSFDVLFSAAPKSERPRLLLPDGFQGRPVLVVDDNAIAREVLGSLLEGFSFEVETASSGREAIILLEQRAESGQEPYCIVFLDWKMPGLDGLETARIIKTDLRLSNTPAVLMVTAYGREEVMEAAEKAGLDGFLTKPVGHSLLFNTILETLGEIARTDQTGEILDDSHRNRLDGIRGAKVLLVEDNPINQQVAMEFLEQAGLVTELAENGLQALEALGQNRYELVLMDVQMPEMDGLEATRRLRERGFIDLPVVAMTAHALAGDRERSIEAGMNDHLSKPIDPDELENVLLRWIPAADRETASLPVKDRSDDHDLELPDTDGLDAVLGLGRVGGSRRLFLKLLGEFAQRNNQAPDRIREYLAAGQWSEAERLAHSIKGAAASLGAEKTAAAANSLEKELREENEAEVDRALPPFEKHLKALCNDLSNFFARIHQPKAGPAKEIRKINGEVLLQSLTRLSELLEMGSSKAERVVEEILETAVGFGLDKELKEIEEAIEDVEFSEALEMVKTLIYDLRRKS